MARPRLTRAGILRGQPQEWRPGRLEPPRSHLAQWIDEKPGRDKEPDNRRLGVECREDEADAFDDVVSGSLALFAPAQTVEVGDVEVT